MKTNRKFKLTCWLVGIFTAIYILPELAAFIFRCNGIQVDWSLFSANIYLQGIVIALGLFVGGNVAEKYSPSEKLRVAGEIAASKVAANNLLDTTNKIETNDTTYNPSKF